VSGELTEVEYWSTEGVQRAHGELNIGLWRMFGEFTRAEYWTMDNILVSSWIVEYWTMEGVQRTHWS
jgi:hypothetical protein